MNLGTRDEQRSQTRNRATEVSIQKKTFLECDLMAVEQGPEFIEERDGLVMFTLALDVPGDFRESGFADRERCEPVLPRKFLETQEAVFDPDRRTTFDTLHGIADAHRRWETHEKVDVIIDATDRQGLYAPRSGNASEVSPDSSFNVWFDPTSTVFGAEDNVAMQSRVSVSHEISLFRCSKVIVDCGQGSFSGFREFLRNGLPPIAEGTSERLANRHRRFAEG